MGLLRFEAEHLRLEHLRRLDERLAELVGQVRAGEIEKGTAALALSVAYDDEERGVMIDFALKGTVVQKGRYGVPRIEEPELPFEDEEPETIVAGDGRLTALNPPPPLALGSGDVIDVEVIAVRCNRCLASLTQTQLDAGLDEQQGWSLGEHGALCPEHAEAPKRRGRRPKAEQNGQDEEALAGAGAALPTGDR